MGGCNSNLAAALPATVRMEPMPPMPVPKVFERNEYAVSFYDKNWLLSRGGGEGTTKIGAPPPARSIAADAKWHLFTMDGDAGELVATQLKRWCSVNVHSHFVSAITEANKIYTLLTTDDDLKRAQIENGGRIEDFATLNPGLSKAWETTLAHRTSTSSEPGNARPPTTSSNSAGSFDRCCSGGARTSTRSSSVGGIAAVSNQPFKHAAVVVVYDKKYWFKPRESPMGVLIQSVVLAFGGADAVRIVVVTDPTNEADLADVKEAEAHFKSADELNHAFETQYSMIGGYYQPPLILLNEHHSITAEAEIAEWVKLRNEREREAAQCRPQCILKSCWCGVCCNPVCCSEWCDFKCSLCYCEVKFSDWCDWKCWTECCYCACCIELGCRKEFDCCFVPSRTDSTTRLNNNKAAAGAAGAVVPAAARSTASTYGLSVTTPTAAPTTPISHPPPLPDAIMSRR